MSDLRERLIAADENHDPWSSAAHQGRPARWWCECGAGSDGLSADDVGASAYAHMADVNLAAVAAWLRDLAEMRDSSWLPVDDYATQDNREVVAGALDLLAASLTRRDQDSTQSVP